jgi:dihydrofolate reductase
MNYFTKLMRETDLIVYGRKTYELMVPFWPEVAKNRSGSAADIAFAEVVTPIEKIVLSRTLKKATYNTRIVSENPEGLIRELKQQPGKKIALSSTRLLPYLLELGLIDELYLVVHPILIGENKRLFENFLNAKKLYFYQKHSQLFKSGAIALHYQR